MDSLCRNDPDHELEHDSPNRELAALDDVPADIALVQEASRPDPSWAHALGDSSNPTWQTALIAGTGHWRTAVLKLSDAVELQARSTMTLETATSADDWVVSRAGSIAAADITVGGQYVFTAVSVYAAWEKVGGRKYADGSAHRILSDLSALALGGCGWSSPVTGTSSAATASTAMTSGEPDTTPCSPAPRPSISGLSVPSTPTVAKPTLWPQELPPDNLCVPTFHHNRQSPSTATRQVEFVFASAPLAQYVDVRALNQPDQWGPSDHCRW